MGFFERMRLRAETRRHQQVVDELNRDDLSISQRAKVAGRHLGEAEVAAGEAMSDEQVDEDIGREALDMKRRDPAGYERMLASFPPDARQHVTDAVARAER
jgi:hypothetical protein